MADEMNIDETVEEPKPVLRRIAEGLAERTGAQVVDNEQMELTEAQLRDRRMLIREMEEIAWRSMDYMGGNEQDMIAVERRNLVQKARIAWQRDPQLGGVVDLMNDFVLGRGVPKPRANDPEVQKILDEAWDDEDNRLVLTSYEAQLAFNTDLTLQSNVFFLAFDGGKDGKFKVGILDHDTVENVVRHPDNRRKILYYVAREKRVAWDFTIDGPKVVTATTESPRPGQRAPDNVREPKGGVRRIRYYQHCEHEPPQGQEAPKEKLGEGRVYHVAINRTGEMAFGHPTMHRTLRWATAFNSLMEARVDMMAAAAAIIMKRKVKGTPNQVQKQAQKAMSRRSELARGGYGEAPDGSVQGPRAASVVTENEGVEHEAFKLDTGASNAETDGQMVKGQISASTHFPQHYLGDKGSANLANACHDELTETLTDEGWMNLDQLKARAATGTLPRVAAFDTETGQMRYHRPKGEKLHLYPYEGKMASFQTARSDMLVTPNHRMLVRAGQSSKALKPFEKIAAEDLPEKGRRYEVKAAPLAAGVRVESFVLPAVEALRGSRAGGTVVAALRPPVEMPMDAWLKWMGWYIAEGSGDAEVCQSEDSSLLDELRADCAALGIEGIERRKEINGKGMIFWRPKDPKGYKVWLDENVGRGAQAKRLPPFVFELHRDQQERLLAGLMAGDGLSKHLEEAGYTAFFTASKQLADDVQRLALHCGFRVKQRCVERRGDAPQYVLDMARGVSEGRGRDTGYHVLPKAKWEHYEGEVYCFATPDDTMITRRNGKVAFHCNTAMELPVIKTVEARQEIVEGTFRWFCDNAIKKAIEDGRLKEELTDEEMAKKEKQKGAEGKADADTSAPATPESRPDEAQEAAEDAALELDTAAPVEDEDGDEDDERKRDLSYDFGLPSPQRRMLSELSNSVSTVAKTFDPNGTNVELSKVLLGVVLGEGLELVNAPDIVEKVFPPGYVDPALAAMQAAQNGGGQPEQEPPPGPEGGDQPPGQNESGNENPYSAPMQASAPDANPYGSMMEAVRQRGDDWDEEAERIVNAVGRDDQ